MNTSPKKQRAPFRPVDTLLSPQKPSFKDGRSKPTREPSLGNEENSYLPESDGDTTTTSYLSVDHSAIEHLGNSSSLFDEQGTPPPPPRDHTSQRDKYTSRIPGSMVREREPPGGQSRAAPPAPNPIHGRKPADELLGIVDSHKEAMKATPEFGKPSPMKSPLKNIAQRNQHSNVFNQPMPGHSRPEHHRDHKPISIHRSTAHMQPTQPFPPNVSSRYSTASSVDSDVFEIPASEFQARPSYQGASVPRPMNAPPQTIHAPPRPMYSSMGHANGFQPVNRNKPMFSLDSRKTVILDDVAPRQRGSDDDDDFDPDTAIRAEQGQFGAPDAYAYVDSTKANENIKALLEGAFDEENIPRTRGRKKKKQQEDDNAGKSLADRLAILDMKESQPEKASLKEEKEGEEEEEEDDGTVDGMKVKLLPHQVEGVAWMIEKETGAHNKRAKLPKGGILADDMGLGKTVQSIAVILSNTRPEKGVEPENKKNKILPTVGKGTLIVAPLALIKQWESEINDKVSKSHSLKVLVHHGQNRTKSVDKLKTYDVVITTYQVLASEHASCGDGPDGLKKGCFGVHWYRVMLDEAHTIKNRNAKMTKACYDVRSHYRWCLTGTPMQNNLDELQSLIRFLRIQPYCDMPNWKDAITGPMKNGRGNLAMRRLQIFLKAFMKRRTKDVLKKDGALNFGGKVKEGEENKGGFQIVARNIETVIGEFTAKERSFYDRLNDRAESRLREMMGGEKTDYIGALVLLLRLRQACNHPNLTKSNMKEDKDALTTGQKSNTQTGVQTPRKVAKDTDADDLADLLGGLTVETKRCDICQNKLHSDNAASGAIRCNDCEADLNASITKPKKDKKSRKHKHKDRKEKKHRSEHAEGKSEASKASRQRRVIVDSDDEDEAGGEWLVGEDEQGPTNLGKAGGTDDENAEGGGDTLASIDSHSSADENENSVGSFIVHDTESEEDGPIVRNPKSKKLSKPTKAIDLVSDDNDSTEVDSDSEDDDSGADSEEDSDTEESDIEYNASDLTPSTKIRQLLTILEKETPDHKVIVFSQFTSMLDLIEPFLRRGGYNFTRYDGKMRNDLREASLAKLRNDKRCRVLICSLKCGSLGLNLTAASRVVIMEPFWNPFVEEQAIDRVHRLNQTVDVTVYRLSIHNSVEERILALQEAKRKLAQAAIEGGKAVGKLSMQDILALFKRDAEYDHQNVDDGSEHDIFTRTRVLEERGFGQGGGYEAGESTAPRKKEGSLGFKRPEHSVYGRR